MKNLASQHFDEILPFNYKIFSWFNTSLLFEYKKTNHFCQIQEKQLSKINTTQYFSLHPRIQQINILKLRGHIFRGCHRWKNFRIIHENENTERNMRELIFSACGVPQGSYFSFTTVLPARALPEERVDINKCLFFEKCNTLRVLMIFQYTFFRLEVKLYQIPKLSSFTRLLIVIFYVFNMCLVL